MPIQADTNSKKIFLKQPNGRPFLVSLLMLFEMHQNAGLQKRALSEDLSVSVSWACSSSKILYRAKRQPIWGVVSLIAANKRMVPTRDANNVMRCGCVLCVVVVVVVVTGRSMSVGAVNHITV